MTATRPKTYGICGGAFGDEGKGRIVDNLVHELSQLGEVVVYRDNGGANAGHTVEFPDGQRIALHQLPSGVFIQGAIVVLGKEMVIHPGDLLTELEQVAAVKVTKDRATIKIDELAIASLDTHRAFEAALKNWQSGGKGSTGRGIAPAYADVLLRHPVRLRDLVAQDQEKISAHYDLYSALMKGLSQDLAAMEVPTATGTPQKVGTKKEFIDRVFSQVKILSTYVADIRNWLNEKWSDQSCAFVFEKAQAVGLDYRWGVYPDVTASDTTFAGIYSATEGTIDPDSFLVKAGVIKATYMSSVGTRRLPTIITDELADRIRKDAHEYGATTKRPRDIAYLDLPALSFFSKVGKLNALILTHMDIVYSDQKIKICTGYTLNGKKVSFHPDQEFLNMVDPVYTELSPWDAKKLAAAKTFDELPKEAQEFLVYIAKEIGIPIMMITTGPKRDQGLMLEKMIK